MECFKKKIIVENPIPYKDRVPLSVRQEEVNNIRLRFPNKVPVIIERYQKEKTMPFLNKTKFLVPQDLSIAKFVAVIRNRLQLSPTQSFYIVVDNTTLVSMAPTMRELYKKKMDKDGFLYITYASQEMFGNA